MKSWHSSWQLANSRAASGHRQATAMLLLIAVLVLGGRLIGSDPHAVTQIVRERTIMGTTCRLIGVGPQEMVSAALDRAWDELKTVERTMSTWDPDSELSRFNAAPAHVAVPLSEGTMTVLRKAVEASALTDGAFDVTMRPLAGLWKTAATADREPTPEELAEVRHCVGVEHLVFGTTGVHKSVSGLEVTLDGIAPGYAVQCAVECLRVAGLDGGLIDVGGDIACFGRPLDDQAWQIGIQDPWSEGLLKRVCLQPKSGQILAISTSGDYRRFLEIQGRRYSHILDPRSGRPVQGATSVTVTAENAVTADLWATALSVLGVEQGTRLMARDSGVSALFLSGAREQPVMCATPGFPGGCDEQ